MSLKLYVLIRDDMSPADQAVQAGHAIAQFGLEHPEEFKAWQEDSNILIYLAVDNVSNWTEVLKDGGFKHSTFVETGRPFPSLHDPCYGHTAIAVAPNWICQYLLFKDLPLALQPKGTPSRSQQRKRWYELF